MVRYFLKFSYIGTLYRGAQKNTPNPNICDADSIQGSIENALTTLIPRLSHRPQLELSSRTDAGVHALAASGHVDLHNKEGIPYVREEALKYLNRYFLKCKHTIRILDFVPVTDDFETRRFILSRTYIYRFMFNKAPNEHRIPIVDTQHCYFIHMHDFDINRVINATKLFHGLKDFTTFAAKTKETKKIRYVRSLNQFTVEPGFSYTPHDPLSENFSYWHIVCNARSFLYNQVRRMTGALIALGQGKITEKDITVMFQVPSHYNWDTRVTPLPSHGLHLWKIEYNEEELKKHIIQPDTNIVSTSSDEYDSSSMRADFIEGR